MYVHSIYNSSLSNKARIVYVFLKDHSDRNNQCFHSIRSIAAGLGISYKTVQRAIKELKEEQWVVVEPRHRINGGQSSNLYTILKKKGGE